MGLRLLCLVGAGATRNYAADMGADDFAVPPTMWSGIMPDLSNVLFGSWSVAVTHLNWSRQTSSIVLCLHG